MKILLLTTAILGAPLRPAPSPQQTATAGEQDGSVAARALGTTLSFEELDELLIERRAKSDRGREVLDHYLRARLLERLAAESNLVIGPDRVQKRWDEIERTLIAQNEGDSLVSFLRSSEVDEATFREFLRLAIIQEVLSRRALGVREGQPLNTEQQEMWLDQIIGQRGTDKPMPPWKNGVAARCGDLEIGARDFVEHLRTQLDDEDMRTDCYQLLLVKRMLARMPDLSQEALDRAVDAELQRRRDDVTGDERYKGLTFEQIVGAQGIRAEFLRRDPAVRAAALAWVWVDRSMGDAGGDEGLRQRYESERELFDGKFGAARDCRVIFLRAARLTNQLIPRSFEQAERELANLRRQIENVDDFARFARTRSEDTATRDNGGSLGFVTRGDERAPQEIRELLHSPRADTEGPLLGPVRIVSGSVLIWVGERRPAPGWTEMKAQIHAELRRRFVEQTLPKDSVWTFLDAE